MLPDMWVTLERGYEENHVMSMKTNVRLAAIVWRSVRWSSPTNTRWGLAVAARFTSHFRRPSPLLMWFQLKIVWVAIPLPVVSALNLAKKNVSILTSKTISLKSILVPSLLPPEWMYTTPAPWMNTATPASPTSSRPWRWNGSTTRPGRRRAT